MDTQERLVTGFATELVDEVVGASNRKWAIFVFALVAGAFGVLFLMLRFRGQDEQIAVVDDPTNAAA